MSFYRFSQRLVRTLWPIVGPIEVEGIDRIPREDPFILIANHQSALDPILIQAICPRPIHTMAKSTQFSSPLVAQIMYRLNSFPVRRYRIDPQAVRHALRVLDSGEPVGIYIEGERTWDGRLQRPRLGTVRLILKAGVPVIPCTIDGAYDVWPRWDRGLRKGPIRITFGEPMVFPRLDDREAREEALPEAARSLMARLAEQVGEGGERGPGVGG